MLGLTNVSFPMETSHAVFQRLGFRNFSSQKYYYSAFLDRNVILEVIVDSSSKKGYYNISSFPLQNKENILRSKERLFKTFYEVGFKEEV